MIDCISSPRGPEISSTKCCPPPRNRYRPEHTVSRFNCTSKLKFALGDWTVILVGDSPKENIRS